jgi:membrane protease YdiL (CAAX protease family)
MQAKRDLYEPLLLSAFLLAYSNGLTWLAYKRGRDPERAYLFTNPLLLAAMLLYASHRPGGLSAVGLTTNALPTSSIAGLITGGLLSIIPLLFFHKPFLLDTPLEYGPVLTMTRRQLLQDIALRVVVNIAFMEELAFRGLLYDSLRTRYSNRTALFGSATVFALWHFAVTYATTKQTNLAQSARLPPFLRPYVHPLAILGGMLTTVIAGLAFASLRFRTNNLAAPIAAHWLVDSVMIVSLWGRGRRRVGTLIGTTSGEKLY